MTYNFDEIIDRRNTNSENVEGWRPYIFHCGPERVFPYKDEEFIRMWVADMEFAVAPEILQAITDRVDRRILGYTLVYDKGYYEALRAWCESRYGWSFPKEQLTFSPGVIPALYQLTEDLVKPLNGKVLTMTPAYGFFLHACEYNGVELVTSPLREEGGRFSVDWEDLEAKAADPDVKLLMLCNPHNPAGRVWTPEELRRIGEICLQPPHPPRPHLDRGGAAPHGGHHRKAPAVGGVRRDPLRPDPRRLAPYPYGQGYAGL